MAQKNKKYICDFCARDDFNSRQALSYHRLNICDKRPQPVKLDPLPPPRGAAPQKLSDIMVPAKEELPPEQKLVPPEPPVPPSETPPAGPGPDESAPEPEPEISQPLMHPLLFFFVLVLIGFLVLIVLFWNVVEREGRKFLKRFDPPVQEVTDAPVP